MKIRAKVKQASVAVFAQGHWIVLNKRDCFPAASRSNLRQRFAGPIDNAKYRAETFSWNFFSNQHGQEIAAFLLTGDWTVHAVTVFLNFLCSDWPNYHLAPVSSFPPVTQVFHFAVPKRLQAFSALFVFTSRCVLLIWCHCPLERFQWSLHPPNCTQNSTERVHLSASYQNNFDPFCPQNVTVKASPKQSLGNGNDSTVMVWLSGGCGTHVGRRPMTPRCTFSSRLIRTQHAWSEFLLNLK